MELFCQTFNLAASSRHPRVFIWVCVSPAKLKVGKNLWIWRKREELRRLSARLHLPRASSVDSSDPMCLLWQINSRTEGSCCVGSAYSEDESTSSACWWIRRWSDYCRAPRWVTGLTGWTSGAHAALITCRQFDRMWVDATNMDVDREQKSFCGEFFFLLMQIKVVLLSVRIKWILLTWEPQKQPTTITHYMLDIFFLILKCFQHSHSYSTDANIYFKLPNELMKSSVFFWS